MRIARRYTLVALMVAIVAALVSPMITPTLAYAGGGGPAIVVQHDVANTTIVAGLPPVSIPDSAALVASQESVALVSFAFTKPTDPALNNDPYVSAKLIVFSVAFGQLCVTRALFDGVINPTKNIVPGSSTQLGCFGLLPGWNRLDVSKDVQGEQHYQGNVRTYILSGDASILGINAGRMFTPRVRIAVGSPVPVG